MYRVIKDFPTAKGVARVGDIYLNDSDNIDLLLENGFIEEIKSSVGRYIPEEGEKYWYMDCGGIYYI
jgi:hypothetical protein